MKLGNICCIATLLFIMRIASPSLSLGQTAATAASPSNNSTPPTRFSADYRVPGSKEGLVPDKETAIKIAEVVLFRRYSAEAIIAQRPYVVKEEEYIWWISGTIKEGELGFAFNIAVAKHTAAILHLTLD